MARLFNAFNNEGSTEIMNLTGQWQASNPFNLIETEIRFATREVAKLTGDGVMRRAEEAYLTGSDMALVDAVRLPVACLAVMRHSALSGISHEHTGRRIVLDDNTKSAYEWQVDRDDRAMRERYFRALDAMYDFLDSSSMEEWETAPGKVLARESIVKDITQFEAVYPIDGSYYVYYMLQALVVERQKALVAPFAGEKWPSIADGTASGEVMRLARRASVLSAVATAATRWSLEVFPIEIARRFSPTFQGNKANKAASMEEIDWYLGNLRREIEDAMDDLAEELNGGKAEARLMPDNHPRNKFFTTE